MKSGLSKIDHKLISKTIKLYPEIQQAILFGSRAKGTYKKGSDIDIALYLTPTITDEDKRALLLQLHEQLDETLPYFFDLPDVSTITNTQLIKHIDRVGVNLLS